MSTTDQVVLMPAQDVPVAGEYDVVVCGAGPAGAAAAIAAGRRGRSVLLVDMQSQVGGLIASVGMGTFCDSPGGPIFDEMMARLLALGAASRRLDPERYYPPGRHSCHAPTVSAILLEMLREAGVELLLLTLAEGAWLEDGAVAGAIIVNKAGRSLARARVVIDCTADADIAASAGTPFRQGDPRGGWVQHCNSRCGVEGVDADRLPPPDQLEALCREAVATGCLQPPDALFGLDPECFPFTHESGTLALRGWELQHIDPTDPAQVTEALAQCQLASLQLVRFLRERVPGCESCRVTHFPAALATRESRRIVGGYTLTGEDVLAGAKFEDGVVPAWFFIDLHDPAPATVAHTLQFVQQNRPRPGDWYEIPYRCLVPVKPPGLLVAGRCISCDRPAQGSLRVIPTCFFLGQAAGTAAARAIEASVQPHELDGAALKAEIMGEWHP
ncbi:MAG: FAD-dependent oxidoreductase [Armatimonadota bacterium]